MNLLALPCTLSDALQTLSKEKLVLLRNLAETKTPTTLRKHEVRAKLEANLADHIHNVFNTFDDSRASLMRLVLSHRGAMPLKDTGLSEEDLEHLTGHGVFFVGEHGGALCLGVPLEILERFKQHDGLSYAQRVAVNTRWVAAVQGLVYHYGAISMNEVYCYFELVFNEERDFSARPRRLDILFAMQGFNGLYRFEGLHFCDRSLDEAGQLLKARPAGLGYKLFNLEEVYAAAEPWYIDETPESELLYDYLREHYSLPDERIRRLMHIGRRLALREGDASAALAAYAVVCNEKSPELNPELVRLVADYLYHTPHWALCGHSMAEMAPFLPPQEATAGKLVDFSEYKKRGK